MLCDKPESIGGARDRNRRAWEPNIKVVKAVVAFAVETNRSAT